MDQRLVPVVLPLAVVVTIAVVMLGLGTLFITIGRWGTVGLGLAIVVLVPLLGFALSRRA